MWRRFGLNGLNYFSLFVAVAVVVSLAVLVYVLVVPNFYRQPEVVYRMLVVFSLLSLLSIVTTVIYQAAYFSYSESSFQHHRRERERWMSVWNEVMYNKAPLPTRTADVVAAEALLLLKEKMDPQQAERARHTYEMSGLLARDMRIMQGPGNLLGKVRVIERWAILCDPQTHQTLYHFCFSKNDDLRRLALTALARSMGLSGVSRREVAHTFHELIRDDRFSSGWIEQVLVLLDSQGIVLLQDLLKDPAPEMQLRALRALAYVRADECLDECLDLLHSEHPDIRASSLKVLSSMHQVPQEAVKDVYRLLDDPVWFVRAQAALACGLLKVPQVTTKLYDSLADEAWWVRHNSAQALSELGAEGQRALETAVLQHPDRYARDMASQYLQAA
ncbi:HEAT repeat domain-containing protein [Deinococcus roseus]|uniref:HEAT repeat domain-containing protein n=1 Tax=Deinococcus roseus TaxID=392414 RepID=A0ABQ2CWH3_9DEIO|nr:HEAT repeat domain-containing protein [Deinococcus roseus]GGJ27456.1 hypothetical protein GCM10008938_11980 [Deinococcus roseus]